MPSRPTKLVAALALAISGALALAEPEWTLVRRVILQPGLEVDGFQVGGLSGVAFDKKSGLIWAVSDARRWETSKVFRFELDFGADGEMQIRPHSVLSLVPSGRQSGALDAEGIALWTRGRMFISHEGSKSGRTPPGIDCFGMQSGKWLFSLPVPDYFSGAGRGLQHNRGFEGVALARPKPDRLYAACESPLLQDLPDPLNPVAGPVRILRYDPAKRQRLPEQRAYVAETDAVFGSVTEVLGVHGSRLYVLERQLTRATVPRQRRIRIFEADFDQADATEVAGFESLRGRRIVPLAKRLVFDSEIEKIRGIDNIEGMCWGPELNGRPTLLLVSDDNFSKTQHTEFLLLAPKDR